MARQMVKTPTPGIYKREGRYVVVWQHRGRQHKEFHRTYAEAREAKARRSGGDRRKVEKVRLGDYADSWIKNYRGRTARGFSETTRDSYRDEIERRIKPYFGRYALAEIDAGDVTEWFGWMEKRGVSPAGVRKAKRVLSAMLADALQQNRLRHGNPCLGVRYVAKNPEPPKPKPRGLTPEELARLLGAIPGKRDRVFVAFLAHTGVRIGEALGLRWRNVSLGDDPHVEIVEQVYKGERKSKPKTHHSIRTIPLTPNMARALAALRERGEWIGPDDPVFPSEAGTPIDYSALRRRVLLPAKAAAGIDDWPKGQAFHMFRKTAATLGHHRGGWSNRQLADVLGHSDPGFTQRVYVGTSDRPAEVGFLDDVIPVDGARPGQDGATDHPQSADDAVPVGKP